MHPQDTRLVHVYALLEPSTGEVRYIGQTAYTPSHRLNHHLFSACHTMQPTALATWLSGLVRSGCRPGIVVLETLSACAASAAETAYIARYLAQGAALLNEKRRSADWASLRRALPRRPLADRLWGKVVKTPSCWMWTGGKNHNGYGLLTVNGRRVFAHRLSYELVHGPIPNGLFCLHRCEGQYARGNTEYRACVHPNHLYLGTHADNMADIARHKRGWGPPSGPPRDARARGERHWSHLHPERVVRGEANGGGGRKLTADMVRAIRGHAADGRRDWTAIGREFGVSKKMVMLIVRREKWAHVSP